MVEKTRDSMGCGAKPKDLPLTLPLTFCPKGIMFYVDNSKRRTHPVGRKLPNAWGLYDIHGNVREWVSDWFRAISDAAVTDPQGPETGTYRVVQGPGGWYSVPATLRSYRSHDESGYRDGYLSARLVMEEGAD
ncbi:MAG: formylglycine-generating enzyme family protein [Magnetococcales bacterium]|nr:formylglycine-generating enzyme family protein [Magnetococcales bacterium]